MSRHKPDPDTERRSLPPMRQISQQCSQGVANPGPSLRPVGLNVEAVWSAELKRVTRLVILAGASQTSAV